MLRSRPTVISLTCADVTDVVHRRRFRKFLECDDDNECAFTPADTESTSRVSKPSPSRILGDGKMPPAYGSAGNSSPSAIYSRIHPLIADLPVLMPSDKGVEDEGSSPPDLSSSQVHRLKTRGDRQQSLVWTPQLCLRPKRSLPGPTTAVVDYNSERESYAEQKTEGCGIAGTRDAGSSLWLLDPGSRAITAEVSYQTAHARQVQVSGDRTHARRYDVGPSTPPRGLLSASFATPPTAPTRSGRALTDPFDDSDSGRNERSASEASSPMPVVRTRGWLRIYNDSLPASSQPQTPQNLPRARHQSRLQGSYTAPARSSSPQRIWTLATTRSRRNFGRRRETSPLGLQSPGFRGLYGGMENRDDAAVVEETAEDTARSWGNTPRPSSLA